MPDDVPRTLADLTPSWLSSALDTTVTDAVVTPIAEGEGFMGRLARVEPSYGDGGRGPASMIAKIPTDDPNSVAIGQMLRVWEREASFYRELAPKLPVRTPRCHYAGGDPDSGIFALLLEDLAPYDSGDQLIGASPAQAEAAIDWLGRFHAAESGEGHSAGMEWLPATATSPMYQGLGPMLEAVWPAFVDKFGALAPPGTLGWVERMIPRWNESMASHYLAPTLVHADFRVDNLFFDRGDGRGGDRTVIALDWQSIAHGEGLYDVAYFLGGSLPTEQRRATEHDLVRRYGRVLRENGAPDVPGDDELFDHYRRCVLMAMTVGALLMGQLDLSVNQRAVDLANAATERIYTTGKDLAVDQLIED
ncbi:MAG TPA: phosphotransferase [Acidimicrobiales bacterium]|nr:phosphotransferase [Acidimicrobiales bacterium]